MEKQGKHFCLTSGIIEWVADTLLSFSYSGTYDPPVDSGPCRNGAVEDFQDPLSVALIFCVGKKSIIFCRHTWKSAVGIFCIYLIKRFSWHEKFGLSKVYNIQLIIKKYLK